jgi:HD-GYP domain-containing protein (c-di-GMP phosphodiesterase class II)/DNA-binding CsgD family transcriptional regulator
VADEIPAPARYAAVAFTVVMFDAIGGIDDAVAAVTRWSGRALDPAVVSIFLDNPHELLRQCQPDDVWAAAVAAEPRPQRFFRDDDHLDEALAGFGDAADLKAPFFQGHARGVASLARSASRDITGVDAGQVYRAGLLHDLGRVAVPSGIWERPGPLRPEEWDLVRLHPYHSERIVSRSPVLSALAAMVSRHHERLDGSGYPGGVHASELDPSARLLAAADTWRTLGETRPHRPRLAPRDAARAIVGRPLDRDAVRAVLAAADAPTTTFPRLPVDLTERELQILRLLTDGQTKRQIAENLVISIATVHTHTVHIYGKCEVSTRAGLAMFAMRHGLTAGSP